MVWNTVYRATVVEQLKQEGYPVQEQDLAHVSPTRYRHINTYGNITLTLRVSGSDTGYGPCDNSALPPFSAKNSPSLPEASWLPWPSGVAPCRIRCFRIEAGPLQGRPASPDYWRGMADSWTTGLSPLCMAARLLTLTVALSRCDGVARRTARRASYALNLIAARFTATASSLRA